MAPAGAGEHDLRDRVAVVAGGTRGAGRGIAVALGARGATVYVTGRSSEAGPSDMGRAETIEETARLSAKRPARCARSPEWTNPAPRALPG